MAEHGGGDWQLPFSLLNTQPSAVPVRNGDQTRWGGGGLWQLSEAEKSQLPIKRRDPFVWNKHDSGEAAPDLRGPCQRSAGRTPKLETRFPPGLFIALTQRAASPRHACGRGEFLIIPFGIIRHYFMADFMIKRHAESGFNLVRTFASG